ncbi:MAG: hypothetical protein A3G87_03930 [Omnitrophica bacterium RIFCSPLOWO2_12_FULL_50_11]|nr:MAG: hypothetical protein A3G87_03930 [Omnitrophica bacterium RIFCSPLOWO2_12_FULL_50_11]
MVKGVESIIIIDDDRDLSTLLERRLEGVGYHAKAFCNSAEAVKWIRETPPDLIISDVKMPGLNGFDVCDLVRNNLKTQHIPIIMITGIDEARQQLDHLDARGIYCLSKPVDPDDLSKVVRLALDSTCEA